jgi:hypothetical protein
MVREDVMSVVTDQPERLGQSFKNADRSPSTPAQRQDD